MNKILNHALLLMATFCLAVSAQADIIDNGYTIKCRWYYQDSAVLVNSFDKFVLPIGFYGWYLSGTNQTFTCDPKAISTLASAAGYYVTGWDLDEDWGDESPLTDPTFEPTVRKHYGAVNPLTVTFSEAELGESAPVTLDLVPHISMMHYTLSYNANATDAKGTLPTAVDHYWSESVTAPGKVLSRTGYTQKEKESWNTKADGSGVSVTFGQAMTGATFPVTNHNQSVTLYAQWQANNYPLQLNVGTGIAKICYRHAVDAEALRVKPWTETTANLNVAVAYDSVWEAYAVAKVGYTYSETSQKNPESDTMGTDGGEFAPVATPNKISVTFNGNGNTSGSMSSQSFNYNESQALRQNGYLRVYRVTYVVNGTGASVYPTSEDATYTFTGWNNKSDGTGAYNYLGGAEVTNPCDSTGDSVTLYAKWNSDSVSLPEPSRTGYDFTGWYAESGCTTLIGKAGDNYTPTSAIKLYAGWNACAYNLRLSVNSGIAKIYYRHAVDAEALRVKPWTETTADLTVPLDFGVKWEAYAEARPGYTYDKYCATNKTYSSTIGTSGAEFAPVATRNKITVVFEGNGKTSGTMSSQTFEYDESQVLSENAYSRAFTVWFDAQGGKNVDSLPANYPFVDWNSQSDGKGAYSYADKAEVTNPCGSTGGTVRIYAQWDTNKNNGVTLPSTTQDGHTFAGWYTKSSCLSADYVGTSGDLYIPTNNVTLYAGWDLKKYTVTFYNDKPDDGGTVISTQTVHYGYSAVEPDHPTKQYYKFSQWNTTEWKSVKTDNLKVWPIWAAKNYCFVYHSNYNNGQDELSEEGDSCNKDESPRSVPVLSSSYIGYDKIGYSAVEDGWNTDPNSSVAKYKPTASLVDAGNDWIRYNKLDTAGDGNEKIDIYAIWSPNSYAVKFNKGVEAATGEMPEQEFTYDSAQPLTKNAFTYAGQKFQCWVTSPVDAEALRVTYTDQQLVSNLTTVANETVNLYAVWTSYHYVRFDPNTNGLDAVGHRVYGTMDVQKFSGGEEQPLFTNCYGRVGYTFAGWATNTVDAEALRVTYTNAQSVAFPAAKANETNVLYAVWATNRYTIVFDPGTNGVYGTMEPLTNCAYDTAITIQCGYTNSCSMGLDGWARIPGAAKAEFVATESEPYLFVAVVSNLTAEANATQTLYAVWQDVGELSKAVGLTNAALYSTPYKVGNDVKVDCQRHERKAQIPTWDRGHDIRVAWVITSGQTSETTSENSPCALNGVFKGAGTLKFSWCFRSGASTCPYFRVCDGENVVTNLVEFKSQYKQNWDNPVTLKFEDEGLHAISWRLIGTITSGDLIAIDDVSWTPGEPEPEPTPVTPGGEMPTYDSQADAEQAASAAKVTRPAAVESVISADDYQALFVVRPTPSTIDGKWTLAIELKPAVSNAVQSAVDAGTTNLVKQFPTAAIHEGMPLTVSMMMQAGLYYGLATTNQVEWLQFAMPTNWVLGTGNKDGQSLSVGAPSPNAGYFKIHSRVTPPTP